MDRHRLNPEPPCLVELVERDRDALVVELAGDELPETVQLALTYEPARLVSGGEA